MQKMMIKILCELFSIENIIKLYNFNMVVHRI